jgi:Domain of unknown function (DUF4388)
LRRAHGFDSVKLVQLAQQEPVEPAGDESGFARAPCGGAAGSCLWPAGKRVQALLPGPMPALRPVLWGDLAELAPSDLLSLLEHHRSTGLLVVSCEGVERVFSLIEGQLVWACSEIEAENRDIEDAVRGLLEGRAGTFSFLRAPATELPQGAPREIRVLLLDGMRRLDESRR